MSNPAIRFPTAVVALAAGMLACQAVSGLEDGGQPTQAPILPTSTPAPTSQTSSEDVLYEEDFDDPNSGWLSQRDQDGITDYDQGGYRIKVDIADWFFWIPANQSFSDVQIDVDTTKLGGPDDNEFGVICRYVDEENFYFFSITSDGFYGITKLINDEYEFIGMTEMVQSDSINQGAAANHLQAVCDGANLRFSVNGTLLAEVQDDSFSSGDVGLIAGSGADSGADILFDNLVVTNP